MITLDEMDAYHSKDRAFLQSLIQVFDTDYDGKLNDMEYAITRIDTVAILCRAEIEKQGYSFTLASEVDLTDLL